MYNYSGKGVVDFLFSNIFKYHPSKVKNENHQILMCDTSKEPPGLSDHRSEDKI